MASPIELLVKDVLAEEKVIAPGVAEKLAAKIDPVISGIIDDQATKVSVSAQMLEGILANPNLTTQGKTPEELSRMAMNYSSELIKQIKKQAKN